MSLDSHSDEFGTPREIFDKLNFEFNFTIDAAASHENHLLSKYWTKEDNALSKSWSGERVFCNPPYSKEAGGVARWVESGIEQIYIGGCQLVVFLIPSKTEQKFFRRAEKIAEIRFFNGRVTFTGGKYPARDSHCLIIFRNPDYYVWTK